AGFDHDTSEAVRDEALNGINVASKLKNTIADIAITSESTQGLQRVSDVSIYASDAIVRRSVPLQATADAVAPKVWLHSSELERIGVQAGVEVRVSQGQGSAILSVAVDDKLPKGVVRVAAAVQATSALGSMFGTITVERA
ncbi:MAG: molybdopterin dinucleotide binding domain-containing protein, partial [Gallionellaceae bacterium]|nr:molybdopterin dinucleotide binding domain-containing protein [Gallionellaceae bacterium]